MSDLLKDGSTAHGFPSGVLKRALANSRRTFDQQTNEYKINHYNQCIEDYSNLPSMSNLTIGMRVVVIKLTIKKIMEDHCE